MRRSAVALCLLACCWGCDGKAKRPPITPPGKSVVERWQATKVTHVQVEVEPLSDVANSGLLLPAVSPDGRWIAQMDLGSSGPVELEALFTGEGLQAASLYLRELRPGASGKLICAAGAAWPAWSADSKRLVFVAYTAGGRCDVVVHDVAAGTTRRVSAGFKRMMMPAISPSGKQVAVVAGATQQAPLRLHVLTLETSKLQACPIDDAAASQLYPQWTADGRIVYLLSGPDGAQLVQWGPGKFPPEKLCDMRMPRSRSGIYGALAGLGRPLSPDDRRFAYYDDAVDRIVLVDLRDGRRTELRQATRSGCWFGSRRFIAATDKEMLLFTDGEPSNLIMRGAWLPRGAAGTNQLIACIRGAHRGAFGLVRMKITLGN